MCILQVVAAFNILLSDKQVKAILVNIFGELLSLLPFQAVVREPVEGGIIVRRQAGCPESVMWTLPSFNGTMNDLSTVIPV